MKPTEKLHEQGQSLWLDNITRERLTSGTLRRYIDELVRRTMAQTYGLLDGKREAAL